MAIPGFILMHVNGLGSGKPLHFQWVAYPLVIQVLAKYRQALKTSEIVEEETKSHEA